MSISVTYESEYTLIVVEDTRFISPISTTGTINKFELTDYPSVISSGCDINSSTGVISLNWNDINVQNDLHVSGSITVKISNDTTSKSFTFNVSLYYIPFRFRGLLNIDRLGADKYQYLNSNFNIQLYNPGYNYSGDWTLNFYNIPEDISLITTEKTIGGKYNIIVSGHAPSTPCIYSWLVDVTYTPANLTETFQCSIHVIDHLVCHYNDYTCYLGDTVKITPVIESGEIYKTNRFGDIYDTNEQYLGGYYEVFSDSLTINSNTGEISGIANREGTFILKVQMEDPIDVSLEETFILNIIDNHCVNCTNCIDCFYCTDCIDCNNCNSCTTCIACNTCSNCSNCSNCRDCVNVT